MLKLETIMVTPFMQNARLIWDTETKEAVIIDPGGDAELITAAIERNGVTPKAIWLTHSHLDHCGGVKKLVQQLKIPLYAHPNERTFRENVIEIAREYGLNAFGMDNCPEPDHPISGGETLGVGSSAFQVLFTPGHSPGHLCFYNAKQGILIAGDTLFAGSIGRTDLPGCNHEDLLRSIRSEILTLPDNTRVFPGHGGETFVGEERAINPFLMED